MAKNGKRDDNKKTDECRDINTARAALLDFFGDNAISFSNQFLASMFGLVASSAIIQSIFVYLLDKEPLSGELTLLFLLPASLLFGGLSFMLRYTYQRFQYYSGLANNVATGIDGIMETAKLDDLYVRYDTKVFIKNQRDLERTYLNCELPESTPMFRKKEKDV